MKIEIELTRHQRRSGNSAKYAIAIDDVEMFTSEVHDPYARTTDA